jgi:D-alanyl-D-alanine carboxypeptidase
MWSRSLALALLLLPAPALAGVKENVAALAPQGLVLVMDAKGNELVAHTDEPFVPASVTKIVTAWLAMEVLGGDYRFKTGFYLDDKRVGIDTGKNILHLIGLDDQGAIVLREKIARGRIAARVGGLLHKL